ncbi:hypothetical protein KNN17_11285 [Arthrobacter bambusae]|uniref:hypothetical protein n=1 Tax=Arthrobacter bambusae TaxID=1338426 RepID=UPI001F515602|nr:hypothetical protein [Arthrobacter bambusae]MCI0142162.1 hypothetical protein [Arthrobacter bambusae]
MSAGTPRHTIRISDELWNEAHRKALREGTSVSELIRTRLHEYVAAPDKHRHTIADSLVYLVPDELDDLHGPAAGTVELPLHLDWGPERTYNLDDAGSCSVLYQLTLQNSGSIEEICRIVNAGRLTALWSTMILPARCRQLWETSFPQLPTPREAKEHPSWTTLSA